MSLLKRKSITALPDHEQFGFVVLSCYVRDVRLRSLKCKFGEFLARLVEFFNKAAKASNGPLSLTESVVAFFKNTGGVCSRKRFLPQKASRLRPLRGSKRPAAQGSRSKVAVPCLVDLSLPLPVQGCAEQH